MSSNNRKYPKDNIFKSLDIGSQYINKAKKSIKKGINEIGKYISNDTARPGTKAYSEKLKDVLHSAGKKQPRCAGYSATVRLKPKQILAERTELTRQLNWAVRRTYYADGGYRYFGQRLVDYVNGMLDKAETVEDMWIGGYNTCIQPMNFRMQNLERSIEEITSDYGVRPLPLENEELLSLMRRFISRAKEERLNQSIGWERSEYFKAIRQYACDLNEQLLAPYPYIEDN